MLIYFAAYLLAAAAALVLMSVMILRIGTALSECPITGRAAHAGALTIVTGYSAIGTGAAFLVGAGALVVIPEMPMVGLLGALGLCLLGLGIGFGHAVGTLRQVVGQAAAQAKSAA